MKQMKEVTRYQCKYCKKDFKTPDRHYCKFNPELKNCFTCKYLKGWKDGCFIGYEDYEPPCPDCAANESENWDIEYIKQLEYNMQCEGWKEGKYDWINNGGE